MGQEALVSLAILKVNWDEKGRDYVDNFVPFVVETIKSSESDRISLAALQTALRERFGLLVPQGALNTLLRRAERQGFVARDAGTFVRRTDGIQTDFASARAEAARRQAALIAKLIDFVKQKTGVQWTEEQALTGLLAHLQSFVVPILAAAAEGTPLQATPKQPAATRLARHWTEQWPSRLAY